MIRFLGKDGLTYSVKSALISVIQFKSAIISVIQVYETPHLS